MKSSSAVSNQQPLRRIARAALEQYGLDNVAMRMIGNVHNDVFRVTARPKDSQHTRQFVLRLHMTDWLSDVQIESEAMWLEAIRRDTTLTVPQPVRNESGDLLTNMADDMRICTLLHWLEGRVLWKRPSTKLLHKMGRLMGNLQHHGRHFARPADFVRPKWDCAAMTGRTGQLNEGWDQLPQRAAKVLSEVCDRFNEAAQSVGTGPDNFGLIHGDLHVANVLSQKGAVAAIDFDDCRDGYYLSDIAATLDYLEFRANYRILREAFLSGYYEIRPLSAESQAHINVFLAARWVTIVLYLARRSERKKQLHRVLEILTPKLKRFLRVPESLG